MSSPDKPLVLVVGATGHTGAFIVNELLAMGTFRVAAIVRPSSAQRQESLKLKDAGVDIRIGDLTSEERLISLLQGVDILISAVVPFVDQRPLLRAAKQAGVKRVVPSEFGPAVARGRLPVVDEKYAIRQYIIDLGLTYTFIWSAWWGEFLWPYPHSMYNELNALEKRRCIMPVGKECKVAYTMLSNVGKFVARIITDPRTLNQTIMAWDGELSLKESWTLAEKVTGEDFSDYTRMSAEDFQNRIENSDDEVAATEYAYMNSIYFHGDNTVANAKEWGALDARELYPDYQPTTPEMAVRDFYKDPFRIVLYFPPPSLQTLLDEKSQ